MMITIEPAIMSKSHWEIFWARAKHASRIFEMLSAGCGGVGTESGLSQPIFKSLGELYHDVRVGAFGIALN